jgi:hypothetical protein
MLRQVELQYDTSYQYPQKRRLASFLFCFVFLFWPLFGAALAKAIFVDDVDFWVLVVRFSNPLQGGVLWLIFVSLASRHFLLHRPIRINQRQIQALLLGRAWREINWSDIRLVEKVTFYDVVTGTMMHTIRISSNRRLISFKTYIEDFESLREEINQQLHANGIPVATVDVFSGPRRDNQSGAPASEI